MPYADPETQKEYQRLYYLKYLKKSIPKKKRINLPRQSGKGLINDVRTNCINKPLQQSYNSGKDFTPSYNSDDDEPEEPEARTVRSQQVKYNAPKRSTQSFLQATHDYQDESDDEPIAPKIGKRHWMKLEDRNPFLLKLTDETAFNTFIHNEIPQWIHNMTSHSLRTKIQELGDVVGEDRLDKAIDYWNSLFGEHKTRRKLEYAYKYLLDITRDR